MAPKPSSVSESSLGAYRKAEPQTPVQVVCEGAGAPEADFLFHFAKAFHSKPGISSLQLSGAEGRFHESSWKLDPTQLGTFSVLTFLRLSSCKLFPVRKIKTEHV